MSADGHVCTNTDEHAHASAPEDYDPRIAALAEALHTVACGSPHADGLHDDFAAAILAALPPDWWGCNHIGLDAEFARLRKIEEAAREVADDWFGQGDTNGRLLDLTASMPLLRAALGEKPCE